jgi:hypothetical protein
LSQKALPLLGKKPVATAVPQTKEGDAESIIPLNVDFKDF